MAPLMTTNTSSLSKLKDVKQVIRCLLISLGSRDISLNKLNNIYKEEEGEDIPFKEFNFTCLRDFLFSIPDILYLEWNNKLQSYCAYHKDTEKSQHISSLVARERKRMFTGKSKSRTQLLQEKNNTIDPQLLLKVLKDLRSSRNNKIKKQDILLEIQRRIGTYSFYSMRGLNNQLSEFLHLLNYDSDYIYFKESTVEKNTSLQKPIAEIQNKIINDNEASKKLINLDSISIFIKETIQERLIKLIEKYPNGIWCSELPKLYVKEFGYDLQYDSIGFNSITEFVAALPHIFKIVVPSNTQKQMVVDARRDSNDLLTSTFITSTPAGKSSENIEHDSPPYPSKLSPKVTKTLIPENTMNYDETVDHITVSSLFNSSDSIVDVIVSEVHNPSFFWIMLRKNKKKLDKLMFELQNFYSLKDLNKYKVANAVLHPGLNIACTFADMWHRGIVKKINPNGVEIHFYDYGTISSYDFEEIYYLDKKFAALPAQAIPCGLYNIHPIGSNKWPSEINKKFQNKVFDKAFVASIFSIDEENNSMIINLIDTTSNVEVYINEWMITKQMAEWKKCNCKKNNFAFQHYRKCLNSKESATNDKCLHIEEIENKMSFISIDLTVSSSPTYINSKKKIEAVEKYKAKLSSSLSSTSLASITSFASEDSASSLTSASSVSSVTSLNNDGIDEKQNKKDKDSSNESQEKINNPEFSSKDFCSSQSSLLSTDSFLSNTSSDKSSLYTSDCSKLMFKSSVESTTCDSSYSSSNRNQRKNNKSMQETVNSSIKELQKLKTRTKI